MPIQAAVILALAVQQLGAVLVIGNGALTVTSNNNEPELPTVFAVPMADTKTIDKLDDFDRYVGKKAWELAFKTMDALETDGKGMVPASAGSGGDKARGFLFPSTLRIKQSLLHLPPEGREAYRLFNDSAAKALMDKLADPRSPASGAPAIPVPAEETATLRKIVNQYFLTSIGDVAADRLGDMLFEQGNYAAAASNWQSVVEDYPDSHLPALKLQVKRCVALSRLGKRDELAALVETVKQQYAGQRVTIGGQEVDAAEFVQGLHAENPAESTTQPTTIAATQPAPDSGSAAVILKTDEPAWQIKVTRNNAMADMEAQIRNMGWGIDIHFVGSLPTAAVEGNHVYVNWMGVIYAADLATGKMLWRSGKFSEVSQRAQMFAQYGVDPDHFSISAAGGKVFALRVDPQRMQRNEGGAYMLDCFDGATGKSVWTSSGSGTVLTAPVMPSSTATTPGGGNIGYVASISNDQNMTLNALNLQNGKSEWSVPLGKPQGSQNNWGGGQLYGLPELSSANGMVYVATNNGALVAVNVAEHRVEWAFKNQTKPVMGERIYYQASSRIFETPATLREEGGTLFLKDSSAPTLYAIDLETPSLKWRRRIGPEEMVIGVHGDVAYLQGQDLSGLDLKTQQLLWSTKIPVQTGLIKPLVEENHIYVASERGIYDVDPSNGDVLHIFRGADKEASGGRLLVAHGSTGDELICVTDTAVTAYPLERSTK